MAELQLSSANERQIYISKFYAEFVRLSGYMPYMGKSPMHIIHARYEANDQNGKTINIPLIARLKGAGVTGAGVLEGNEEQLDNFNCPISLDWVRNAVVVPKSSSYKTEMDLWNAAKDQLKQWSAEHLRDSITRAMLSVVISDTTNGSATVNMASATTANRNTYAANNADRLLFGASRANYSATFATALGNIDSTSDKLTTSTAMLAKRMARAADPHIRPYMIDDGREFFVMFCGSRTFRDLKQDTAMVAANREARAREGGAIDKNPLFRDGDMLYDGIIFREVPEIDDICSEAGVGLDGAGNSGIDVRPNFLCGAQAVGIGWGQEPTPRQDVQKDYQFRPGVAIEELRGVRKLAYNGKQHGMVTLFTAAAADS